MTTSLITLNGAPAPMRSDLTGADALYELNLLLGKLQPGDTLRVSLGFLLKFPEFRYAWAPELPYPFEMWEEHFPYSAACLKRLA
jgi:hypothetical protein